MPRADNIPPSMGLLKALIIGDPKSGKTDWTARAAEAGFNVLYMDGDVGTQTIAGLSPEAKSRIFIMDVSDKLVGDQFDPRMIQCVADFMTSSKLLWNDNKQQVYSSQRDEHNEDGTARDEIWEFRPSRFDHNWVWAIDSWTTLAYSGMLAKANEQGVSLADIEKVERSIYQGVGNRLTNMLATIQKAPCHVVVIGHPRQFEKTRAPEGKSQREIKEIDRIVEWTKMVPASSSNPHGLTMGKFFTDIGWMDVTKMGKRELNFKLDGGRSSGGHLDSKGDPRDTHSFANLVRQIGGTIPDGTQGLGQGLIIHPAGTFVPAVKKPTLGQPAEKAAPLQASISEPKKVSLAGIGGLPRANPTT